MAHEVADARDITPQEALLGLVRTAAARAAWSDAVVASKLRKHVAAGGDPMDPPAELVPWLRESRDERTAATRTAKAAIDGGVMVALERRLDLEGEVVADTLAAVLDVLGLDHEQRLLALTTAQAKLAGEPLPGSVAPVVEVPEPDLMEDFKRFAEREGFDPAGLDDDQEDDDDDIE